jgi:hypothetical protein
MRSPFEIPYVIGRYVTGGRGGAWTLRHPDGSPYLTRTVLWGADCLETHDASIPSHAFVHEIHSADGDRHMHDHPWKWAASVILSGGYTERRIGHWTSDGKTINWFPVVERTHRVGDLSLLNPKEYHSIVAVEPNTVTLFLCGREISDWGFLVDGEHVPHSAYFKRSDVQPMTTTRGGP